MPKELALLRAAPRNAAYTAVSSALRNRDLPWVRSLTPEPFAWTNSPAEIIAAWPRTVIRSRWPRALTRRTQKPFSELWNVTRSTRPAKTLRRGADPDRADADGAYARRGIGISAGR